MAKKKKADAGGVGGEWIVTYSDMVTLMLCFFVALFNPDDTDPAQLAAMISAFNNIGLGSSSGGNTLSSGKSADLGNTIMSLPSMDKGRVLGNALRKAVSLFNPEVKSNKVKVTHDERGLVISLASDAFFNPASARINIEETRDILVRLASLLNSDEVRGHKFRVEGHTDSEAIDPLGPWEDNWQLSSARAIAVLRYLTAIGVQENRFQVAGFADTMPVSSNNTPEGRAYNRRVDIIILDEGHL
ncbi:flagellar motor protein MotB [Leadbettera azotonutricia]|uniref:Chemotaxis protein MotB n=1 Tax=Leadbettera azotonutricia (strain ATCC BAA-888 / DSM 13862 / ZAS-9) TaxID=545695 RepID=F5YEV8_LEAAZ|nr:flagellar motor protein MotB [Leadbettera azotonutricia]AEF83156.1 chemotaxis protein MotB [Leadbettera azotonutricia ZAS-9]